MVMTYRIKKVISGEYKGKEVKFFQHGYESKRTYQEVVNGKINEYPYYSIDDSELYDTGIDLPYAYNTQIEIEYDFLKSSSILERTKGTLQIEQELINKAMVIAYRIIDFTKDKTQFKIRGTVEHGYDFKVKHFAIEIIDRTVRIFDIPIATITIVDNEFYVFHEKLHKDERYKYSRTKMMTTSDKMRESFDHKLFGMKYKKFIDLNELPKYKK